MPGWQVISWVVVLALPVTVPAVGSALVGNTPDHDTTAAAWSSLVAARRLVDVPRLLRLVPRPALAGIARGGQVQQLQALLTLLWSALFLGEQVSVVTVMVALVVTGTVLWAQRVRTAPPPDG